MLTELEKESKTLAQKEEPNQQKKQVTKDVMKEEEIEVNIDSLMKELRSEISGIYSVCCGANS